MNFFSSKPIINELGINMKHTILKRFLTVMLCFCMAFSPCIPAAADEDPEVSGELTTEQEQAVYGGEDEVQATETETEAVTQAFYKVSEKLYQAAGGAASGAPNPEDFAGYGNPGATAADGGSPFTTGGDDDNGFKNAGGDF
jgi:hypothetical protein